MRRPLAAFLAILASGALAAPASADPGDAPSPRFPKWNGPAPPRVECRCRKPGGERVSLGSVVCLRYGQEWVMARCEMPQNLPFWRILDQRCAPQEISRLDEGPARRGGASGGSPAAPALASRGAEG